MDPHHHGLRWQHKPFRSVCPLVSTSHMDINMASWVQQWLQTSTWQSVVTWSLSSTQMLAAIRLCRTQSWPSMAAWTQTTPWPDLNGLHLLLRPGGSIVHEHQHGLRWQQRSRTQTWHSVVKRVTDINTGPRCSMTKDPDMAFSNSNLGLLDITTWTTSKGRIWITPIADKTFHPNIYGENNIFYMCNSKEATREIKGHYLKLQENTIY